MVRTGSIQGPSARRMRLGSRPEGQVKEMDAYEIIEAIRSAKKKTPVKAYIKANKPLAFENCHVFTGTDMVDHLIPTAGKKQSIVEQIQRLSGFDDEDEENYNETVKN